MNKNNQSQDIKETIAKCKNCGRRRNDVHTCKSKQDIKGNILIFGNDKNISNWETPKYFGIIPKPRYINVYSRRLAKNIERLLNNL